MQYTCIVIEVLTLLFTVDLTHAACKKLNNVYLTGNICVQGQHLAPSSDDGYRYLHLSNDDTVVHTCLMVTLLLKPGGWWQRRLTCLMMMMMLSTSVLWWWNPEHLSVSNSINFHTFSRKHTFHLSDESCQHMFVDNRMFSLLVDGTIVHTCLSNFTTSSKPSTGENSLQVGSPPQLLRLRNQTSLVSQRSCGLWRQVASDLKEGLRVGVV